MKYFNDPQQKQNSIKLIEKAANSNNIDELKEISRIYLTIKLQNN